MDTGEHGKYLRILSLGAGVQSSALLLMSCRGDLPKLDAAIFADTQWEPQTVYDHLEWLKTQAEVAGIPLLTVTKGNLREHTLHGFVRGSKEKDQLYATLPLRVKSQDGSEGMIRRQCTREYKIEPVEKAIKRDILGLKPRQRVPKGVFVEQWHGISADEAQRMRSTDDHWRQFVYPFCGVPVGYSATPTTMRRSDVLGWLQKHYPERSVPRSSCLGCPFHSNAEWRAVRSNPKEWAETIEVDRAIRHADGMDGEVFLHHSYVPLEDADLGDAKGQRELWGEECGGVCGV